MDIETFTALAERLADDIPEPLLAGLDGGIAIKEGARRRAGDPPGVYLMGEYVTDELLGSFILIYYGSFRRVLGDAPEAVWEQELWETLRHEVRHHLEARAGLDDLDREDAEELRRLWREWEERRARRRGAGSGRGAGAER